MPAVPRLLAPRDEASRIVHGFGGRTAVLARATAALDDDEAAARRHYELALEYQERSERSEGRLLGEFELAAAAAGGEAGARSHGYVKQVPSTKEKEGGGRR